MIRYYLTIAFITCIGAVSSYAQPTVFTYQGRLTDNLSTANGAFEMHFALYDAQAGGTQVGPTITFDGGNGFPLVQVVNGIFTVELDFGVGSFSGAERYLQIAIRRNPQDPLSSLTPRNRLTSAPYAVRALESSNFGGSPPGGFIRNTTSEQAGANFNISGNGTAGGTLSGNVVDSATEYNIGGLRVLSTDVNQNLRVGVGAGQANVGFDNTFVGYRAGAFNTSGRENVFAGMQAGVANSTGRFNSFFGTRAGDSNLFGHNNTFLGSYTDAGSSDLSNATAVGHRALVTQSNSLVLGSINGANGATADTNIGIGTAAPARKLHLSGAGIDADGQGDLLVTGAGPGGAALTLQSTGPGGRSISLISTSDGALPGGGRFAIYDGGYPFLIDASGQIGIGIASPARKFHLLGQGANSAGLGDMYLEGVGSVGTGITLRSNGPNGRTYSIISTAADAGSGGGKLGFYDVANNTYPMVISSAGNVGIGTGNPLATLHVGGVVRLGLASGGSSAVCLNSDSSLSQCSSSLRYKTNIGRLGSGIGLIRRLNPITFNWKNGGLADVGLVAEDVEKIEPLLVTRNNKGEVEGVKYDRIGVVLVNAVNEQQTQIEAQKKEIDTLKERVALLEALICGQNKEAAGCREKK